MRLIVLWSRGGGTPRKLGRVVHFLKPLPYFQPKYLIFPILDMAQTLIPYFVPTQELPWFA